MEDEKGPDHYDLALCTLRYLTRSSGVVFCERATPHYLLQLSQGKLLGLVCLLCDDVGVYEKQYPTKQANYSTSGIRHQAFLLSIDQNAHPLCCFVDVCVCGSP